MFCFYIRSLLIIISMYVLNGVDSTCNFTNYEEYIATWKNRYYTEAQKLYPYGETYCDQNVTSSIQSGFNPGIQFPVYFYGVKYLSLWVTPHGLITLNETSQPTEVHSYFYKQTWPNENYPETPDVPFIAPFYSQADFQPFLPNEPSRLSWRVLDPSQISINNEREITIGMLNALSQEIRNAVVGADDFVAEFGLVITWHKVTFGASDCTSVDNCVRNTYQMALVVGGTETFVVFNYFDIKWVGGAGKQRCDPSTGVSSTSSPDCKAAHIGFNAGYGRHFYELPYSNSVEKTKDIDLRSGSNVTGRFIYSVAGDRIRRGGCTNDTNNLDNSIWPLEAVPVSTDMIGGVAVDVSAPCFHQNMLERTKCSFGGVETDPVRNTHTTMKATCVPPQLSVVGSISLALIVDGTPKYHTQLLINLSGRNQHKVQFSNTDWLNPNQIQITWDPNDLKDTSGTVDIVLAGYREGDNSENIWERLEVLSQMHSNSGTFTFHPDSFQCGSGMAAFEKCLQYHIGAIQVADHRDDPLPPKSLWSEVMPLGWYVKTALQTEHGSDWPSYICKEWDYIEQRNGGWSDRNNLPPCPCTLQQAVMDYGRYQPDIQCHVEYTGPNKCRYNIGAKHCVVSMYSTSSESSGSRCCYGTDDLLMYSSDSQYGSCPDRAHEWGQYPYSTRPRVPSLSHWVKDLAPWYYCCQWQEDKSQCYNIYLGNRRTIDCLQYESPGFASSFGDPHFSTFDGTTYTFNGHGEFWLMAVNSATLHGEDVNFHVQLRMRKPREDIWGDVRATITTAVAITLQHTDTPEHSHIITFVIDDFYENSDNKLMVYVNDQLLSFSEEEAHVQEYQDFIIINHDPPQSKSATNFTVAYRLGVGIRVSFHNGLIQTMISAPQEFKHKTQGLVGQWNGDPADDLLPKGGGNPVPPNDMENVHHSFGLTWMILNSESMFEQVYRAGMDYYYYRDESFLPEFIPVSPEPNASSWKFNYAAADICGDNKACQYDYSVTGNENVAMETKLTQERWEEVKQLSSKVKTCGWLSIPNSIKKEPYNYLMGSTVTIEGCMHNYQLEGPTQYTCENKGEENPTWNPLVSTRCVDPDAGLSPALITAIVIPSAILFFLLVLGIFLLAVWLHKRKTKGKPTRPSEMDSNYIDDSFSHVLPPVPLKTAGKPRPTVNTSLNYSTDHKDDTVSSIDKYSLSSKEVPSESTYTDMTKGSTKKKRQKSANLDDSISIESDDKSNSRDRLNIDFESDVNSQKTKSKDKTKSGRHHSEATVSYKPDPNASKTRSTNARGGQTEYPADRYQPPLMPYEARKPPYQYPKAKPNILSGISSSRPSPYYNPPSPQQKRKAPYVYPR